MKLTYKLVTQKNIFCILVFIPHLEFFASELNSRFFNRVEILSSFHLLFDENFAEE